MSKWSWPWSQPEKRASINYTDTVAANILAQAQGGQVDGRTGSGAQAACGLIGRTLSSVELTPIRGATRFDEEHLQPLSRDALFYGQALFLLRDQRWIRCHPQAEIKVVHGKPEEWVYRLQVGEDSVTASGSRIIHIKWASDPSTPAQGISPLTGTFARFAAQLESVLLGEARSSSGYLVGVPRSQETDFSAMTARIKTLSGGLFAYERSDSSYLEGGQKERPLGQDLQRIGIDPPQTLSTLWTLATSMTVESCGVPAGLLLEKLQGVGAREAMRRLRVATLEPLMKQVSRELHKCGQPHRFRFGADLTNSLTDKARTFASLVKGGMPIEQAVSVSGVLNQEEEN